MVFCDSHVKFLGIFKVWR
ncbi:hypothetical protein ACVFI8_20715 [Agarivorans sp. MS3-6]